MSISTFGHMILFIIIIYFLLLYFIFIIYSVQCIFYVFFFLTYQFFHKLSREKTGKYKERPDSKSFIMHFYFICIIYFLFHFIFIVLILFSVLFIISILNKMYLILFNFFI